MRTSLLPRDLHATDVTSSDNCLLTGQLVLSLCCSSTYFIKRYFAVSLLMGTPGILNYFYQYWVRLVCLFLLTFKTANNKWILKKNHQRVQLELCLYLNDRIGEKVKDNWPGGIFKNSIVTEIQYSWLEYGMQYLYIIFKYVKVHTFFQVVDIFVLIAYFLQLDFFSVSLFKKIKYI